MFFKNMFFVAKDFSKGGSFGIHVVRAVKNHDKITIRSGQGQYTMGTHNR